MVFICSQRSHTLKKKELNILCATTQYIKQLCEFPDLYIIKMICSTASVYHSTNFYRTLTFPWKNSKTDCGY